MEGFVMNATICGGSLELSTEVIEMVDKCVDDAGGDLNRAWRQFAAAVEDQRLKLVNYAEFVAMSNLIRKSREFSPASLQPVETQGSKGGKNAPKKDSRQPLKLAEISASAPMGSKTNRKSRFRM